MSFPSVPLPNGSRVPLLGYGTSQGTKEETIEEALDAGYRHFDTAPVYKSEGVIGRAVQRSVALGELRREDVFITTKLPSAGLRPQSVERHLRQSLDQLQTHYVDLYLIHAPFGLREQGNGDLKHRGPDGKPLFDHQTDLIAVWKAMEAEVDAGRARSIGLSNCNQEQVKRILENCRIQPANLQIELHAFLQQRELVEFCHEKGITVTAYSPLGSRGSRTFFKAAGYDVKVPDLIADPTVLELAEKYQKSPAQILLKHSVQQGIIVIPRSSNSVRLKENTLIFDFTLTPEDMKRIQSLDKGEEGRIFDFLFLEGVQNHPEYPFKERSKHL